MQRANELQVEATLTAFSVNYRPVNLIADKILPIVPVSQETGIYYEFDRVSAVATNDSLRADGARANTVDLKLKKVSFALEEYALGISITDREEENAPAVLQLRQAKTKRVMDATLVDYERRVALLLRNNLPGITLSGTQQWSDPANTSIEDQLDAAKEAIYQATLGMEPNVIIIPRRASRYAKKNDKIRELVKYTQPNLLVNGELPQQFFGLTPLIPGAWQTGETVAENVGEVWGKDVILAYVPGTPAMDSPALGYTLRKGDWVTNTWRDGPHRKNWIEPSIIQTERLTYPAAGYILRNAIS